MHVKFIEKWEGNVQMNITDPAREALKQLFQAHNATNIRVYFAGFG